MALLTSLISHWSMDETSGGPGDSHGSNTLTENGTVGTSAGQVGNARGAFSSSNYFSRADNASLSTGDIDFEISFWVLFSGLGSVPSVVNKDDNAGAGTREYQTYYFASGDGGDNKLHWNVWHSGGGGTSSDVATTIGALSTGVWYYVHCWHDSVNNLVGISINGTENTLATSGNAPSDSSASFYIGRIGGGSANALNGLIDNVSFWKRVLTTGERATLYNGGAGLAYPFGEGADYPYWSVLNKINQQKRRRAAAAENLW